MLWLSGKDRENKLEVKRSQLAPQPRQREYRLDLERPCGSGEEFEKII
jgi:hypothetical protein